MPLMSYSCYGYDPNQKQIIYILRAQDNIQFKPFGPRALHALGPLLSSNLHL